MEALKTKKDAEQVRDNLTTGIPRLDRMLADNLDEAAVMAYVVSELGWQNNALGDRVADILRSRIKAIRAGIVKAGYTEDEVSKISEWLAFLDGFEARNTDEPESIEQAPEPTREQREQEWLETGLTAVREAVAMWAAPGQKRVLEAALAEVSQVTDAAEKLLKMEPEIRKIYSNMDTKTKCLFDVLEEIASVDGVSVGVDYGNKMLFNIQTDEQTQKALKELESDPDMKCLAEAYRLAHLICESS